MKSILHKDFRYVPAAKTNVRNTIRREQARLKALAEAQAEADAEARVKVAQMKRAAK